MKNLIYFLFSISTITFGLNAYSNQTVSISETHQIYLDKAGPIEKRIAEIDFKWNWIVSTPSEDSIAIAQGWYVYMGAQRDQLKADLVSAKIEQLENYYQDIVDLFSSQMDVLNSKISEMKESRNQFAPNYPLIEEYKSSSHLNTEALSKWIADYSKEYSDFTIFLEKLVLNNI